MNDDNRDKQLTELKRLVVIVMNMLLVISIAAGIYFGIQISRLNQKVDDLQAQIGAQVMADGSIVEAASESLPDTDDDAGTDAEIPKDTSETDSIRRWEEEASKQSDETPERTSGIHKVYLTFDDGPSAYTSQILDILKEYNVKATFFVIGKGKDNYAGAYQRIVDEGHTLGMHSFSHEYANIYKSKEAFVKDVNQIQDYIYEMTGVHPSFYRFPGGSSNRAGSVKMSELEEYLAEIDITYFDWNISSGDATGRKLSKAQIVRNSLAGIPSHSESVILFHDAADKKTTVDALPEIIESILAMEDTVILPITEDTIPIQHDHPISN